MARMNEDDGRGAVLQFRVGVELYATLKARAEKMDMSIADAARQALRRGLR